MHPPRPPRLTLALTALLCAVAHAQTTTTPPAAPLTLPDVLRDLHAAPAWQSADLQYLAAQQALDAARARTGLTLTTGADLVSAGADGTWQTGLTARVNASATVLPWSPAYDAVRSAQRALERAALERRDARATLVINAAQQYTAVRLAALDADLASAQLRLARRALDITAAQRAAGAATADAVLEREADVGSAAASADAAQATLTLNAATLANTLGRDLTGAALTTTPDDAPAPAPLADLVARALTQRGDVRGAEAALADARAQLAAATRERALPNLTANAQYGQLSAGQGAAGTVVSGALDLKNGVATGSVSVPLRASSQPNAVALGLSASFNLLDPVADASVNSARTAVASAERALNTARAAVTLDVQARRADLEAARAQLPLAAAAVSRARANADTARAREAAGVGTALDTSRADLAVTQAERAQLAARVNAYLAQLRLQAATGDLTP
ncbi:TolC family protein [Deinococcus maricopensis]|uniref:Outer membrane efflux protein n=1 Tax=Deinococcus maricopensis (strain DSM 21211 / LMG 22137 / NRRL B-23946 / LB-34) TaxID=709986 RepID=E8U826_DEIML|nr:TolC family protein [Deinococcus maricopensis]ADV67215.1 outer membrane efflux protein [Deinococcus maricopensis DSM 21211]